MHSENHIQIPKGINELNSCRVDSNQSLKVIQMVPRDKTLGIFMIRTERAPVIYIKLEYMPLGTAVSTPRGFLFIFILFIYLFIYIYISFFFFFFGGGGGGGLQVQC